MALTKLQYIQNIKNYIADAKTEKVFAEFDQLFLYYQDAKLASEVFLVKGNWASLKKEQNLGLIGRAEAEPRRNKINKSLMDFCEMVLNPNLIIHNQTINQNLIVNQTMVVNNGIDITNPKNLKEFLDRGTTPKTKSEFEEIVDFSNAILEFLKTKITKSSDYSRATINLVIALENFEETQNTEKCFETVFALKREIAKLEKTVNDFLELEIQENIKLNVHPIDDLINKELIDKNLDEFFVEFEFIVNSLVADEDIEIYFTAYLERKIAFIEKVQGKSEEVLRAVGTIYKKLEKSKLKTYYDNYLK